MKNLLYAFIILGTLSAIIAVFIAFSDRDKAYTERNNAIEQARAAEQSRLNAEKDKEISVNAKLESEKRANQADIEKNKALDEVNKSREEARQALAAKEQAVNDAAKEVAESKDTVQKAQVLVVVANNERDQAFKDKDTAEGYKLAAEADKKQASDQRDKSFKDYDKLEKEWRILVQLTQEQNAIVSFSSTIMNSVLVSLDSGDQHFLKGLQDWRAADNILRRTSTLGQLIKAKEYYTAAQGALSRLDKATAGTEEIKLRVKNATANNIVSVDIVTELLRQKIKGANLQRQDIEEKTQEAIDKKLAADTTIIDACKSIINFMDGSNIAPKTTRDKWIDLQKQLLERVSPDKSGENASTPERKSAYIAASFLGL
jgi:hypothetical protein